MDPADENLTTREEGATRHVRRTRPSINDLRSPAAARTQIRSSSAALIGPAGWSAPHSPVRLLLSRSEVVVEPCFTSAFDALSLVQLGVALSDRRLINHAILCYHRAAAQLRVRLRRAIATNTFPEEVQATPYLLFLSGQLAPLAAAAGGSSELGTHLQGFIWMLSASDRPKSLLQLLLLDDYHHYALAAGVRTRRPIAEAMSDSDVEALAGEHHRSPRLTQLLARVPQLLHDVDRTKELPAGDKRDALAASLLDEFQKLGQKVLSWLKDFYADRSREPLYREILISEMPSFVAELDEWSACIFNTAYSFPSFADALAHLRVWFAILGLAALELELRALDSSRSCMAHITRLCQTGNQYSDRCCRAIMFMCGNLEGTAHGFMVSAALLPTVQLWYGTTGDKEKAAWCGVAMDLVRSKGFCV